VGHPADDRVDDRFHAECSTPFGITEVITYPENAHGFVNC